MIGSLKYRCASAFSLVEVIVALAVIAIVFSLSMVAIDAVKDSAKSATCVSNLRQLGIACLYYQSENNGYIGPPIRPSGTDGQGQWWSGFYHWDYVYGNYLEGGLQTSSINSNYMEPQGPAWEVFHCPTDDNVRAESIAHLPPRSYGMFVSLIRPFAGGRYIKNADVYDPSRTYLIADLDMEDDAYTNAVCGLASNKYDGGGGSVVYIDRPSRIGTPHGGKANIVFVDGHVESRSHWKDQNSTQGYATGSDSVSHLEPITE